MSVPSDVAAWLERFAACVRARDFAAAEALVAPDVQAFGTRAEHADGRAELRARQWAAVWPRTDGFRFHERPRVIHLAGDGSLACVAATWESEGIEGDRRVARRGRCTIVLRRERDGWRAVHTHFSRSPGGAA